MRGVIGGDTIDGAIDVSPECFPITLFGQRRPHGAPWPQTVGVGIRQEEVVGRYLASDGQASSFGRGYQLNLIFSGTSGLSPAVIEFQMEDNRLFSKPTFFYALAGTSIVMACFVFVFFIRNRNSTKFSFGRSFTCDI